MGYQESWLIIKSQRKIVKVLELALESDAYASVASVVVLKKDVWGISKGTKILWIVGDRCFHSLNGILNGKMMLVSSLIIPIEVVSQKDGLFNKLELSNESKRMTENEFMKRYDPHEFLRMEKENEWEKDDER